MQQPDPTNGGQVEPPAPPETREAVDLIVEKLTAWGEAAVAHLPNLVLALLVIFAFWLISRLMRRALRRALSRTPMAVPIRNLTATLAAVSVLAVGLFLALGVLGLDRTVTSLLAGVGIAGLALGFAFQDMAANLMSGVMLSFRRPIDIGDVLETGDFFGTVEEINLRATLVRRPTGQLVYIPNRDVLEKPIVNYTELGRRRVDLDVGVSYGDDLEKASRVAVEAVEGLEARLEDEPVELFFQGFGGSSIDFVVRFWIAFQRQADYQAARSAAVMAIKRAFDDNDITIPFPIRTLDFGIVGGQPLGEALAGVAERASGSSAPSRAE